MSSIELRECSILSQLYVGEDQDEDGHQEEEGRVDGAPRLADRLSGHHRVALGGYTILYYKKSVQLHHVII